MEKEYAWIHRFGIKEGYEFLGIFSVMPWSETGRLKQGQINDGHTILKWTVQRANITDKK